MEVSVSFLKSKYDNIETISLIEDTNASSIHVDLMDGDYVEPKNDDLRGVVKLLEHSRKPLEIHLMMRKKLEESIDYLAILKPRVIFIPFDIPNLDSYIRQIRDYKINVGLAIHPDTLISSVKEYLDSIQSLLLMTVYPGKGGQSFLDNSVDRLKELKEMVGNKEIRIGVDGGINNHTVGFVKPYVDFVISGSYVCMSNDYQLQIDKLL